MGTWRISNFRSQAARVFWLNEDFAWDIIAAGTQPTLDNQPPGPPSPAWGNLHVRLYNLYADFYLDGSSTPTAYDDLPEDFGIDAITCLQRSWMKDGVNTFTANFPIYNENNPGSDIFSGAGAQYYWTIQPLGLHEYQLVGLVDSKITLADPYLGTGYPPVFTKWNGFLRTFLTGATLNMTFQKMTAQFGAYEMFVFLRFIDAVDADGYLTIGENWTMEGTYDTFTPPPNPTIYPIGALDFGGAPRISALLDASGIYTLTPGVYHDELYQRTGATATTTNVMIPNPYFKTGFIGDK